MAAGVDIQLRFKALKSELEEFKKEFVDFASKTEKRFSKLYELADGLAGEFKKFDEEQTVLSGHQSDHSDRLEKLEEKVFGRTPA